MSPSQEMGPWISNSWISSSTELSPWRRVASFLLAVAWWFGSANISSSSDTNPAHVSYLFCLTQVEDGVDPLGGPGACGSSLHVQQDEQDVAALMQELRVPHTEVKGAFCLEAVQVVLGAGEWRGGHNLGWLWGGDRGSARLGWRWRLAMMSKLGLEGCDLCCQLGDVLLSGHGGVLAQGLQGLSFLLLSGCVQDRECT